MGEIGKTIEYKSKLIEFSEQNGFIFAVFVELSVECVLMTKVFEDSWSI